MEMKILDPYMSACYEELYHSELAAGMDLHVGRKPEDIDTLNPSVFLLPKFTRLLIPTGIAVYIQDPTKVGLLTLRSGVSKELLLTNGVGIIDPDYQGELLLSVFNHCDHIVRLSSTDRIAQLTIVTMDKPNIVVVKNFTETTNRGVKGFGSTGR